jgi:hypothetical protein
MSTSGHGQESKDIFPDPIPVKASGSYAHASAKRLREDSDSESHSETEDNNEADMDAMDFQPTQNITATQAIGDENGDPELDHHPMPPPLSPEHAAIRADFEIITATMMEQFYNKITADITRSVAATFEKTTGQLNRQISLLNGRITQMQQQLLTIQKPIQPPPTAPVQASVKKILRTTMEKKNAGEGSARTTTTAATSSVTASPDAMQTPATNTRRWETVKSGGQPKQKKTTPPKLITTSYPQAEREVSCHFENEKDYDTLNNDYTVRQTAADMALRRVNFALVDNKDVTVPPFIRARVTTRGTIIFTTSNNQHNIIYEDYRTIIMDALSYYGKCEKVEIGKRFSQFLLHGVPTHLSLPEISHSISTNYPQLVQGQTPRWLTPPDRRINKTNSTIVMTLTGNIKKAAIGRQNLIVCNRECQLDDYISYGRSTQCRNCQAYGHPAALCQNACRCAVCAGPHQTRDHPCTLPACKKGPACTHPPICCANCNTPHKASDPNCPERIKLRTFIQMTTTNQGDAPKAGVAE